MAKPKIATTSLCGCFGCHMSLLDLDERLLELVQRVDFDRSPIDDIKALAEGLTTATADKVLSRQTATEVLVTAIRVHDPEEEMRRLSDEKAQNQMDLGPLLGAPTSGAAKAAETGALARGSSSTGEEPTADGDGDGILSE